VVICLPTAAAFASYSAAVVAADADADVEEVDPAAVPVTEGAVEVDEALVPEDEDEEAEAALASARYPARSDCRVLMVEVMSAASASRSLA